MSHETRNAEQWADCIREAYLASDTVLVKSMLEQALRETNSAPSLLEIAGMIAYRDGDIHEAIRLIETAMFEVSLSISGQLTIANAWLRTGDRDRARTSLTFLAEMVKRVPCSMLPDLTHALSSLEEFGLAVDVCREAFARHPEDHHAVFGMAFHMHRAGFPVATVHEALCVALELKPDSHLYRLNLSVVCCEMNDWDGAYLHARMLPNDALATIPCPCMVRVLQDLFIRFDDHERLEVIGADS